MEGAFIGDIVGSVYEWKEHKGKRFPLFAPGCRATDDSLMTLAVARAFQEAQKAAGSGYCAAALGSGNAAHRAEISRCRVRR